MRLLLVLVVALAAVPAALADGAPGPEAVAACQAEASHLGKDAFVAKYGPDEPFGHCYAAHAGDTHTTTTTTVTTTERPHDPPAVTACKAEAEHIGTQAFVAKYGATETLGHCVAAHTDTGTTTTTTTERPHDPPAVAACKAEAEHIGKDAFVAKYGSGETLGRCVSAQNAPQQNAEKAAQAACLAIGKKLGKDAFLTKFGAKNPLASCVKALRKPKH